jgi:tyrosyl-tRNA synthetase
MSKSYDNYVGLTEPADEMFGKLMSIPDGLIVKYLRLCTAFEPEAVMQVEAGLADGSLHPNEQKRRLAREVVDLYHGPGAGGEAEARFDLVHRDREVPAEVEEVAIPASAVRGGRVWIPRLLAETGMATSNAEGRRAVEQGGVRLDGEPVTDPDLELADHELRGRVLQVGRRRFVRLR